MTRVADRVLVFYMGDEPEKDELVRIIQAVGRQVGTALTGTRVTTYEVADPTRLLAAAMVLKLENEGAFPPDAMRRMETYRVDAQLVAIVWAAEVNAWARRVMPVHLARAEATGLGITRRPGWAALSSETVVEFVTSAGDRAGQRFADVHVAVSLVSETRPRRIRRGMPGGYLEWVDGVFRAAGAPLGEIDVAHWLLCRDGRDRQTVHLAYFATDRSEMLLLPWELLSRAEKRGGNKLA